MQYVPHKEVSLDGRNTRHYVISPAGDVVCSTHSGLAASTLAAILNTHGGQICGVPVMQLDWATSNEQEAAA